MNGFNNCAEDGVECPLCMEPLEVDDLNFFPCTCGYQICRFCWHRIRTDENELCPACRKEYPENPADFTPLTQEEMIAFKSQKRQRDQQRKQKITENRKHLANVRVVQKNLVFVVGLPPRLADADILKKHEYFGKYGKIHKVVINPSTAYAGVQGPSASAYVTYVHNSDALRAIQSVNNIMIDGRLIKTSLGTTKYCSHFMKNQQCPKNDCMYLHELGDPEASFTKEEMHQGKHQEYEKRLHDALIASAGSTSNAAIGQTSLSSNLIVSNSSNMLGTPIGKSNESNKINNASTSPNSSSTALTANSSTNLTGITKKGPQHKEAWPSLSVSPISIEVSDIKTNKTKKEKKNEKPKNEKSKSKNKNGIGSNSNCNSNSNLTNKENRQQLNDAKETSASIDFSTEGVSNAVESEQTDQRNEVSNLKKGSDKKDKLQIDRLNSKLNINYLHQQKSRDKFSISSDEEIKLFANSNKQNSTKDTDKGSKFKDRCVLVGEGIENQRSLSSNSNTSSNSDSISTLSESGSGKSTPWTGQEMDEEKLNKKDNSPIRHMENTTTNDVLSETRNSCATIEIINGENKSNGTKTNTSVINNSSEIDLMIPTSISESKLSNVIENNKLADTNATLAKLNLFDDHNSFFSSGTPLQQQFFKNKIQLGNASTPHLPDLLNGIDGNQNNLNTNEWDEALKNVMLNNKQMGEQLQQRQLQHQLQNQEEVLRMQEFHKRGNLFNSFGLPQLVGNHNDFSNMGNFNGDLSRLSHAALLQQQLLQQQADNTFSNTLFGTNMSKFFDFHKNQQQLNQQQKVHGQQSHPGQIPNTEHHTSHNRLQNQFSPNIPIDDELGFDPFIETQKALAELMETEVAQQTVNNNSNNTNSNTIAAKILQHQQQQHLLDNMQRARMPPPGFNHMNAFGFGVPRAQSSSKILPYMNVPSTGVANNGQQLHTQQQIPISNTWNTHLNGLHSQALNDPLAHQFNQNQKAATINKGYSNNDWTAMDPAILSLRQFPTFPSQSPMPHQQQPDLYLQQLNQQHNNHGFIPQAQHHGGMNLPSALLNSQQPSQAQVNANVQGMLEYLKTRQFV